MEVPLETGSCLTINSSRQGGVVCDQFLLLLAQNTKHYELLNYSEHGTTVDNVLYSCDFSEKMAPTPPSSIVAKVQSVISECPHSPAPVVPWGPVGGPVPLCSASSCPAAELHALVSPWGQRDAP